MASGRLLSPRREILLTTLAIAFSCVWSWSATYTVTTSADNGPGSLRQAITDSNNNLGVDTIVFAIPAGHCQANGVCVINLATSLPTITDGMTLDGTTQPRYGTAPANVCATATAPSYMRVQLVTSADYILNSESAVLGTTFIIRGLAFAGQSNTDAIGHHTYSRGLVQCNHFGIDGTGTVVLDLSDGVCVSCNGAGGNMWVGTDGDGWDDVGERNVFGIGATYRIAALRVGFRVDPQQCNNEVRGTHAWHPHPCTHEVVRMRELTGLVGIERYGVKVTELAAELGKSQGGVSHWYRPGGGQAHRGCGLRGCCRGP